MINPPLNDWNAADFQRSGFDADGKSSQELRHAAGKPQLTPSHGWQQVAAAGAEFEPIITDAPPTTL